MSIPYTASESSSSPTVISTFSAVVPMLQMLYRASDVSTTTTGSTATTSSEQTHIKKDGLGVGAIVGIALGVAVFIAMVGIAVFVMWRRKRKARQGASVKHELDDHERSGLGDAKNKPTEMDSGVSPRAFGRNDGSIDGRNQAIAPIELQ